MAALEKKKLIEYLEHAIKLEGNMVTQKEITDKYVTIQDAKKPQYKPKPYPPEPDLPHVPTREEADISKGLMIGIVVYSVIAAIVSLILVLSRNTTLAILGGVLAIGSLIAVLLIIKIVPARARKRLLSENAGISDAYRNNCQRIDESNRASKQETDRQIENWQRSRNEGMTYLNNKEAQMQAVLNQYYAPDYIYPKYRTLPALTSIYEYLTSGRCEELTGPNGAYNLYEMELRQNTVINQLNTIIENLEQIRNNQYTLYQEMVRINQNTRRISAELSAIGTYTFELTRLSALNAFYNSVTAENSGATTYIYSL